MFADMCDSVWAWVGCNGMIRVEQSATFFSSNGGIAWKFDIERTPQAFLLQGKNYTFFVKYMPFKLLLSSTCGITRMCTPSALEPSQYYLDVGALGWPADNIGTGRAKSQAMTTRSLVRLRNRALHNTSRCSLCAHGAPACIYGQYLALALARGSKQQRQPLEIAFSLAGLAFGARPFDMQGFNAEGVQ